MIPKKPVPHVMRDGNRFSEEIMRQEMTVIIPATSPV
jgi:hypothetical protein